ncbi:MAG: type III-B CRISPR module-associated protein Cmr5 [Spirochaetales bacterium]
MKSLSQKRADFTLEKVKSYLNTISQKDSKEFKSFVAGIPAMILQNGLGLTLAFLLSKQETGKKTKHKEAFDEIKEWLTLKSDLTRPIFNSNTSLKNYTEADFLKFLNNLDQKDYRIVQQEVLSLLEWIKRYAAAFVLEEETNETEQS